MTNENNECSRRHAQDAYEAAAEALWDAHVAGREPTSDEINAHNAAFAELVRISQNNIHNADNLPGVNLQYPDLSGNQLI